MLLLVILLQQGKGDMAAAFGGGSSQSAFGARAGATVLSKATAVLAVLFMLGALALAIMGQRRFRIGRQRRWAAAAVERARFAAEGAADADTRAVNGPSDDDASQAADVDRRDRSSKTDRPLS